MAEPTSAPWDQQFWSRLGNTPKQYYQDLHNQLASLGTFAREADGIADRLFPDSARDASQKNAFRHALGTGLLTQKLGGGPLAATAAKMAGYGWEAIGAGQKIWDTGGLPAEYRQDTLHDLNANNLGASVATQVQNQDELVAALRSLAQGSVKAAPPGLLEYGRRQMTRTVR